MIKIKVKAGALEFLVEGSAEQLTFSLDGKTVGQGKIGNDGKAVCTKGVDMVYTSRLNPTQDIKVTIKEMVRSLSLAITEERQWTEGKPISVAIDKVWAEDGELRVSANGRTLNEYELVEYLQSFLPKHLFDNLSVEPTGSLITPMQDDFDSEELDDWVDPEVPTEPNAKANETDGLTFSAPVGLLQKINQKRD